MTREEFRLQSLREFPCSVVTAADLESPRKYDEHARMRHILEGKRWTDIRGDEAFLLHDCLWLFSSSLVQKVLPALLLACWEPEECDVLIDSLVSWFGRGSLEDQTKFFASLTRGQRGHVRCWLVEVMGRMELNKRRMDFERAVMCFS